MVKDLVVVGSGGLDIVRLIEDINADKPTYNFVGFLEEDESKIGTEVLGYPVLGNDDLLLDKLSHCVVINNVMHTPRIHEKVSQKLKEKYHITHFPSLIHPDVDLRSVEVGEGNIIYKHNSLGPKVSIGDFNILYHTSIGHESKLTNYNLLAKCVVGARVKVGSYNLIGNSTTLANLVSIGDDNEISVGSVVVKNLKNDNHVMGYPAIDISKFVKLYLTNKK